MRASSVGSVDRLAAVLVSRSENMRIEGHTDNVPIHNAHFPSNWELSTSRATGNTSTDGRALSRRVDIVILNPH